MADAFGAALAGAFLAEAALAVAAFLADAFEAALTGVFLPEAAFVVLVLAGAFLAGAFWDADLAGAFF